MQIFTDYETHKDVQRLAKELRDADVEVKPNKLRP